MLGWFPDPYPDELLYSICARLSDRLQYPTRQSLLRELFGTPWARVAIDFPGHLNYLVSVLPVGHAYASVPRLLDDTTLLPFYRPFLPSVRVRILKRIMCGASRRPIQFILGHNISLMAKPAYLKWCRSCVDTDRDIYGECYWHRVHQVPGVRVCPHHGIALLACTAKAQDLGLCHKFCSAEKTLGAAMPEGGHESNVSKISLQYATDSWWLLNRAGIGPVGSGIRERYLMLLADKGLATYRRRVHTRKLAQKFAMDFGEEYVKMLGGRNLSSRRAVLSLMYHGQSPLFHLLMIQFLNQTAESFFALPATYQIFGQAPWPCLNRAADHFHKQVLKKYKVRSKGGKTIGVFTCDRCGFSYSRVAPEWSTLHRFSALRILRYGDVWDSALKRLWLDPKTSVDDISKRLGVSTTTVRARAQFLALPRRSALQSLYI